MSIINDALKKAQKNLKKIERKSNVIADEKKSKVDHHKEAPVNYVSHPQSYQTSSSPIPKTEKKPLSELVGIYIVFIVLCIFIFKNIISNRNIDLSSIAKDTQATITSGAGKIFSFSSGGNKSEFDHEKAVEELKKEIELSGTTMIENRRVALINNEIYEVGG